jgi:hypothetical protein
VYMQSPFEHTHWRFGTARGAPFRGGRGIAISRSFRGEEHCGHVGCALVMSSPPPWIALAGLRARPEATSKRRFYKVPYAPMEGTCR